MNSVPSDRNLLVGMLALQLGLINDEQLMAALRAWVFRKSDPIETILREQSALSEQTQAFLANVCRQHLDLNNGDVTQSLGTLPYVADVCDQIEELDDEDLSVSLSGVTQSVASNLTPKPIEAKAVIQPRNPAGKDRFVIRRPHARGGLGKISIAYDTELNREVALKQIQSKHLKNADSRARFLIEAEVTGRLEHPGVVPVYSLGESDTGTPFYAMKFIRGVSLKEAIDQTTSAQSSRDPSQARLELRQLIQRLVDVGHTIEYAHSRGVLHRDLKPENIMLGKYGETLVVDWGLAKAGARAAEYQVSDEATVITSSGSGSSHTRMGSIFGTPSYMSPEQASGDPAAITAASDVYSLGATLYAVITGQEPLYGKSSDEKMQFVRTGDIPAPQSINPNAPKDLCAVCTKAMSFRPEDRYASAHALVVDLDAWLADEPVSARKPALSERLVRAARRHRTAAAVSATLVLAALLAALLFSLQIQYQNGRLLAATNAAIIERDRADQNLSSLQSLVISLITICENELPKIREVFPVRLKITNAASRSFEQLFKEDSSGDAMRSEYAHVLRVQSNLNRLMGNYSEAENILNRSLEIQQSAHAETQTLPQRIYLIETFRELATLSQAQGRLSQASQALQQAKKLAKAVEVGNGSSISYLRLARDLDLEEATLESALGHPDQALALARNSVAWATKANAASISTRDDKIVLAFALARELKILLDMEQFQVVVDRGRKALEELNRLLDQSENNANILLAQSRARYLLGQATAELNPTDTTSLDLIKQAMGDLQTLYADHEHSQQAYGRLAAQLALGKVHWLRQEYAEAQTVLTGALQEFQDLAAAEKIDADDDTLTKIYFRLAEVAAKERNSTQAGEYLDAAIEQQKRVTQKQPENREAVKLLNALLQQKIDRVRAELQNR